jgi:hypothetical protein
VEQSRERGAETENTENCKIGAEAGNLSLMTWRPGAPKTVLLARAGECGECGEECGEMRGQTGRFHVSGSALMEGKRALSFVRCLLAATPLLRSQAPLGCLLNRFNKTLPSPTVCRYACTVESPHFPLPGSLASGTPASWRYSTGLATIPSPDSYRLERCRNGRLRSTQATRPVPAPVPHVPDSIPCTAAPPTDAACPTGRKSIDLATRGQRSHGFDIKQYPTTESWYKETYSRSSPR